MLRFRMSNDFKSTINKLRKAWKKSPALLHRIQEEATLVAIEEATRLTPPRDDDGKIRGTGVITGDLKSSWATDSITKSFKRNNDYVTVLANTKHYASFVNDGHRMDKHFVPGLMINPYTGLLERAPAGMETGIMVGTQTEYVEGVFMKEQAIEKYIKQIKKSAETLVEELGL